MIINLQYVPFIDPCSVLGREEWSQKKNNKGSRHRPILHGSALVASHGKRRCSHASDALLNNFLRPGGAARHFRTESNFFQKKSARLRKIWNTSETQHMATATGLGLDPHSYANYKEFAIRSCHLVCWYEFCPAVIVSYRGQSSEFDAGRDAWFCHSSCQWQCRLPVWFYFSLREHFFGRPRMYILVVNYQFANMFVCSFWSLPLMSFTVLTWIWYSGFDDWVRGGFSRW